MSWSCLASLYRLNALNDDKYVDAHGELDCGQSAKTSAKASSLNEK